MNEVWIIMGCIVLLLSVLYTIELRYFKPQPIIIVIKRCSHLVDKESGAVVVDMKNDAAAGDEIPTNCKEQKFAIHI